MIVGGGTGGCAAAMAAAEAGQQVILCEPTPWLGGQLTSQAVPPDEHPWIEQFGCTARYRQFRETVRDYYRRHHRLTAAQLRRKELNPGGGTVSRLCCEPRVALAAIEAMLAPSRAAGRLHVLTDHRPVAAEVDGDTIRSVTFENTRDGSRVTIEAQVVLEATELGELLAMAGAEYVTGAESQDDHGEPRAVAGPAQPHNVQAITWCFPVGYDPDGEHVIDRPRDYELWRDYVPEMQPAWPGKLLAWHYSHPHTLEPTAFCLFDDEREATGGRPLWSYRRIVCAAHHEPGTVPHDVSLINWPQNDYWLGNLLDATPDAVERILDEARQLSFSLLYWMQTEAPRGDGGSGYPGLYLRPDLVGTSDGLAMAPYIRESRRMVPEFWVSECHIGTDARGGAPAEVFEDSVGVGSYRIDLHPTTAGDNYLDVSSQPFQIPLGALLPIRLDNLIAAGKTMGTTHITNGCYRLHPVEWNVGEAAGLLAACAVEAGEPPRAFRNKERLAEYQRRLRLDGVELAWPHLSPR